jgi:hypothetical protein
MQSLAPAFLLLAQATADSAATRFVVEHSWLDTLANVAQSLVSVLVMVMLIMGVILLYALRKSIEELTKLVRSSNEPVRAAIGEIREVTGEVRAIAKSLRAPITLAGETLEDVSDRIRGAVDRVEDRLVRFDTLVQIAQEEAEGAVVSAASLLHGVRAGGTVVRQSLGLSRAARRRRARARQFAPAETGPSRRDGDAGPGVPGAGSQPSTGPGAPERWEGDEAEAPRIRSRVTSHR